MLTKKRLILEPILDKFWGQFWAPKSMKRRSEKGPENELEKMQKVGRKPAPILLPSVAPAGTPQAKLLKKLAFGIRPS